MKLIAIITFLVLVSLSLLGQRPHEISIEQAHHLVRAAIPEETQHLPKFGLDDFTMPSSPRFYFVEAIWDNPAGSVIYGNYAVDKLTGEVWSAAACRQERSRRLRRVEAQVRKEIGLTETQYRRIRTNGPLCP